MRKFKTSAATSVLLGGLVAFAAFGNASADQASLDALQEHCSAKLNVEPQNCVCIAETAGKELSDNQQALAVAMLSDDQGQAASLRSQMSVPEVTGTAMFMVNAPKNCNAQ